LVRVPMHTYEYAITIHTVIFSFSILLSIILTRYAYDEYFFTITYLYSQLFVIKYHMLIKYFQ